MSKKQAGRELKKTRIEIARRREAKRQAALQKDKSAAIRNKYRAGRPLVVDHSKPTAITRALNLRLEQRSSEFHRTLTNSLEEHVSKRTPLQLSLWDAQLVASADAVHVGHGRLQFRLGDRSLRRGKSKLREVLADPRLHSKVVAALNSTVAAAIRETSYSPADFDGLMLVLGSNGKWISAWSDREVMSVRDARSTSSPVDEAQVPKLADTGRLTWEVLPSGWWASRGHSLRGALKESSTNRRIDATRIRFIDGLGPIAWFEGHSLETRSYFVAEFPGLAIADADEWGNALYYYMGADDWRSVFRRTKREALQSGAKRLLHRGDWESRLRLVVARAQQRKVPPGP